MAKEKTIVYGDVVEEVDPNQLELGCVHGRPIGRGCPHCLGIGAASPVTQEQADELAEALSIKDKGPIGVAGDAKKR